MCTHSTWLLEMLDIDSSLSEGKTKLKGQQGQSGWEKVRTHFSATFKKYLQASVSRICLEKRGARGVSSKRLRGEGLPHGPPLAGATTNCFHIAYGLQT